MQDNIEALSRGYKMAKALRDITQADVARELDVTQGMVAQYLSGRNRMPDSTLLRVCWYLEINPLEVRPSLVTFLEEAQSQLSLQTQNALAAQLQSLTEPEKAEVEEYLSFLRSKRKQ
jgi:transcriptional regulator with XRE-family HTH domain